MMYISFVLKYFDMVIHAANHRFNCEHTEVMFKVWSLNVPGFKNINILTWHINKTTSASSPYPPPLVFILNNIDIDKLMVIFGD